MKTLPRKPANFSEPTHHQLNMYALAASAAGIGVLALALPAEAKIIYTPADVYIRFGQIVPLDVNHDGVNDFVFSNTSVSGATFYSVLRAVGFNGNAIVRQYIGGKYGGLADLRAGVRVGPNRRFSHNSGPGMAGYCVGPYCHSFFGPGAHEGKGVKNGYVGLKLTIKGKVHYGWARLTGSMGPPKKDDIVGHLTGYAYETTPNKPIITGKTKGPDNASMKDPNDIGPGASVTRPTPDQRQPCTLGMLAFGAQGVALWRRKQNESAVQGN
jgi:hypothetical protein